MRSSGDGVSPTRARPSERAIQAACLFGSFAKGGTVGEGDGAVAFGETPSVRAEHERDVGVSGLWQAEQSCQQDLARGRVHKIRTPHYLAYPLRDIIDHNGELVGWSAVVAAHDEVVHLLLTASEKSVEEGYPGSLRTHSQRRRAS
jgi:hypothetical protein